ncbi:MAG: hypothetical protein J7K68_04215 [Candidatus Diapherotrites archaeon]|nr:hypothetical protein [Candidatus Diapherotrites archaeon]
MATIFHLDRFRGTERDRLASISEDTHDANIRMYQEETDGPVTLELKVRLYSNHREGYNLLERFRKAVTLEHENEKKDIPFHEDIKKVIKGLSTDINNVYTEVETSEIQPYRTGSTQMGHEMYVTVRFRSWDPRVLRETEEYIRNLRNKPAENVELILEIVGHNPAAVQKLHQTLKTVVERAKEEMRRKQTRAPMGPSLERIGAGPEIPKKGRYERIK